MNPLLHPDPHQFSPDGCRLLMDKLRQAKSFSNIYTRFFRLSEL